jgi:PAS domain S-box-containing protein
MNLRPTGIDIIDGAPWGTHFCHFYADDEELADVLVPYFKAGLEANEHCLWVTAPPFDVGRAYDALSQVVKDIDRYLESGRLEILPHTEWYLRDGVFEKERVLKGWLEKFERAKVAGCEGLRLSGSTAWVSEDDWLHFTEYEASVDRLVSQHAILALCSYSLHQCGVANVADVIKNHQFALVRRRGTWELIESCDRQRIKEAHLQALTLERERLAVTLQSIGDAVVATDTNGDVMMLNPLAESLCGWSLAEARGRPLQQVLQLQDERTGAPVADLRLEREHPGADNRVLVLCLRDGSRRCVAVTTAPIRAADQRIQGLVLVLRDVTAERLAECKREEALRRFELLAGTAGELLQARDPERIAYSLCTRVMEHLDCHVFFNYLVDESAKRLHLNACAGLAPDDVRALEWLDFGVAVCGAVAQCGTRIIVGDVQTIDDPRTTLVRKHGVRAYACHPLLGPGGCVLGTLSFGTKDRDSFNDSELSLMKAVTDQVAVAMVRLRDEASLRRSEEALREVDRRKNDFLAVLSHELRNPLAPISNSLYILERATATEEQTKRARAVLIRQVEHLSRLVDDLLDVTRITRNKVALRRECFELQDLVRRVVDDQRGLFERASRHLELKECDLALTVDADPTRIAQILSNLLQNAVRFTSVGGRTVVTVTGDRNSERASIQVTDDGVGIAPELQPFLFEPFMQVNTTLDRKNSGLGLGLSLVKGLVELHGGDISVRSQGVGCGTTFIVRLPARIVRRTIPSPTYVERTMTPRRVLVIEDNQDAAETLREVLRFGHHDVEIAYDGFEGLRKARTFKPEIVLCDIGLPGMTGYDVARAMRREDALKSAHLVALTGYALPEDRQRATDAGFDRHLPKPSSARMLEEIFESLPTTTRA